MGSILPDSAMQSCDNSGVVHVERSCDRLFDENETCFGMECLVPYRLSVLVSTCRAITYWYVAFNIRVTA